MTSTELYLGPLPDDSDSREPKYHVRLPIFDGPLELLLHLIRKSEVEIYDIPIAEITKQYLDTLEILDDLNLNLAGEFLVMAATLIHIKSKMLLPPPHEDGTEDEESHDPRAELVERLLEFERYKEAAQQLHQQEEIRSATWPRPESTVIDLATNGTHGTGGTNGVVSTDQADFVEVDLFELISAFREVVERVRQRADLIFEREVISMEEMMERLETRLEIGTQVRFVDLFDEAPDRPTLVVTFLAILELVRLRKLRIYQKQLFGTIHVMLNDG